MADFRRDTNNRAHNLNAESLLQPLVTCGEHLLECKAMCHKPLPPGICMELYVDPVEFLNCLHLACGACAVQWLANSSSCPQCREAVNGTRDSHYAASVTDVYQTIAPSSDLCKARTTEERQQLREKYRPGQAGTSRSQPRTARQAQQPEPAQFDFGPYAPGLNQFEHEQFPSGSGQMSNVNMPNEQSPSFGHVVERSIVNPESISSPQNRCQSCNPNNSSGYVCPQPASYNQHTIPVGHTICGLCARFLPWREELNNSRCAVCTRTTCHEMAQTCRSPVSQRLQLYTLRDVQFPPGWSVPLGRAFGENLYEQEMLRTYLHLSGLGLGDIFRELVAFRGSSGLPRASWHGPGYSQTTTHVSLGDKTCLYCALDLLEASLFEWWLSKRSTANLPSDYINRQNCPYGITCRTARHDQAHARELNHICQPTRVDTSSGDRQQETPDNGNRLVAESATLSRTFPPYSPSEVIFRDKGNEPMFLCSSIHRDHRGALTIPGRATIWGPSNVTVYFGLDGDEHEQRGVVQVLLDTRGMRWVRASRGTVPAGCRPVVGGRMVANGSNRELYHCAVWWRGQRVPGYTSPQTGRAAISWGGSEWYIEDHYEVLCWN